MNKRLTDFEETRDIVIDYHRAMKKKPKEYAKDAEEETVLNAFFKK